MSSRTYVIGLPVVITVYDDGTVTAEVDLSEAADLNDASIPEGQADDIGTLDRDSAAVEDAVEAKRVTVTA